MFTGIVTATGQITHVQALGDTATHGKQLRIATPAGYLQDVQIGDSIAINGACMTVTALDMPNNTFAVDVSSESLARTTGLHEPGEVNLEKALCAIGRLVRPIVIAIGYGVTHIGLLQRRPGNRANARIVVAGKLLLIRGGKRRWHGGAFCGVAV